MADVSKTQTRMQRSDRPVGRRASILPQRRNQEQVRTQNFGDMRSARIGDVGGAEALMRISQQVLGAGRDFQRLDQARYAEKAQAEAAQGALDASNGTIDEARAAESEAYNNSVRLGQVRKRLAGVTPKVEGAVAEALAAGEGKSLEEREALINDAVNAEFEVVLIDEEGNVLDFGTAQANVYAGNKLMSVRAQVSEDGYRKARLQMDEESIESAANAVVEAVLDGEEVTAGLFNAHLTPTADRDAARLQAFRSLETLAVADPERAAPALQKLLADIEAGNGSDFFDASDEVTVLALSEKADNALEIAREKVRKERYETNTESMFDQLIAGKLTRQNILEIREADGISARTARMFTEALETEERQRRAEARARQAAANDAERTRLARLSVNRGMEVTWQRLRLAAGNDTTDIEQLGAIQRSYEDRGMPLGSSELMQLYGAIQEGNRVRQQEPEYVSFAAQLTKDFGGGGVIEQSPEQKFDEARALSVFNREFRKTGDAGSAYNAAVRETSRPKREFNDISDDELNAEIDRLTR